MSNAASRQLAKHDEQAVVDIGVSAMGDLWSAMAQGDDGKMRQAPNGCFPCPKEFGYCRGILQQTIMST